MQEDDQQYITRPSAGERPVRPAPSEKTIADTLALIPDATIADLTDAKRKFQVESEDYLDILQREKMLEDRYKAKRKNKIKYLIHETFN